MLSIFLNTSCEDKTYSARVIQTSRAGDKLSEIANISFSAEDTGLPRIAISPGRRYQKIVGFGGSFTESSAHVLSGLSADKRNQVIRDYFSPEGAAYSLTRTHMASCDFSLSNYTYAPVPGDTALDHFSVDEDRQDLIPLIRDAMSVDGACFRIVASAWTAPPWMKDNNGWNGGALLPEYYGTWALYFCRYIEEYRREGIPIWAVTTLNEPLGNADQWESMIFTPGEMARFVRENLGPRFERENIDSRILIYDQNREHLREWAECILGDTAAARYVWGTAVHWYSSTIEWYPEELTYVHESFPGKHLMHTEGCIDTQVPAWKDDQWYWSRKATDWGYYYAAEEDKHLHPRYVPVYRYARDIIGGLNSYLTGWIDWNIVLNDRGGPNHAENWCGAPVLAKPETDEVYYTPLYYVMCHFSRYIRPGAFRMGVDNGVEGLMATAAVNPDGSMVVAVLNQNEDSRKFSLELEGKNAGMNIPGSALQSIIIY
ncbi:MAG: glycosyl hydrolase family 30 [Candidatus Latescibacteria bacterium]|nr:glycosyl hydrolase family 30 [Candidatus Latescibacterota bacterium]